MSGSQRSGQLDEQVVRALDEWAANTRRDWEFKDILAGGMTDAVVAVVYVNPKPSQAGQSQDLKVIVKICPPARGDRLKVEPGDHLDALADAPENFRRDHLLGQPFDSYRLRDGRILMFQEYGARRGIVALSTQLDNTEWLAKRCGSIVRELLHSWNRGARSVRLTVRGFLHRQLRWRLEPERPLHTFVASQPPGSLTSRLTPNPLDVALNDVVSQPLPVQVGRVHGDLHPGNILVPTTREWSKFRLIDLSHYSAEAPLATDPIHLLLSIVARSLPSMSPEMQESLIDYLVLADPDADANIPLPLHKVSRAIIKAGQAWSDSVKVGEEWDQQITLSLVGCGLIFAGQTTRSEGVRVWCYRLAANAARAFLDEHWTTPAQPPPSTLHPPAPPSDEPETCQPGAHEPASQNKDLAELTQVTLLRSSSAAITKFLEWSAELAETPALAPEFAGVYGRRARVLTAIRKQLACLEEEVRAGSWPHAAWATSFVSLRARAQDELDRVEDHVYGDRAVNVRAESFLDDMSEAITAVQEAVAKQYPSIVKSP